VLKTRLHNHIVIVRGLCGPDRILITMNLLYGMDAANSVWN